MDPQVPTKKSARFLLYVVSVFILLAIVAGGGYYFYQRSGYHFVSVENPSIVAPQNSQRARSSVNRAYSISTINYLSGLRGDAVSSSVLRNEYEGQILRVSEERGEVGYGVDAKSISYNALLKIQGDQKSVIIFYYTLEEMGIIRVVKSENGQEIQDTFSNLHEGDRIKVTETIDLLKSVGKNRTSIKIIKQ